MPAPVSTAAADRLDLPVRLLPGRLWAALAAFALLVAGALAWAALATIPEHVSAGGVLLDGPAVASVRAPAPGAVAQLNVGSGAPVARGQVIGSMSHDGHRLALRAPVAGTVMNLLARPGQPVAVGAPLAAIDPARQSPRAVLFVTGVRDLAQLALGQRVQVTGATIATGRVLAITPYRATAADLTARFGTADVPGVASGGASAWLVDVALSPTAGPRAPALAPVSASVLVGRQHPYQLVLGGTR